MFSERLATVISCGGLNLRHFHQDLLNEVYLAPDYADAFHSYSNI